MTYLEVAQTLEDYVKGNGGKWDWEQYTQYERFSDPYLFATQHRMIELTTGFPARNQFVWSPADQEISNCILELRQRAAQNAAGPPERGGFK